MENAEQQHLEDIVRKCSREIVAMDMTQASVRTRARAALAMEAATSAGKEPKRRKITDEPLLLSSSSFVQLKPETTLLSAAETTVEEEEEERCYSPTSDEFPASCCSSNGSICDGRINFLDLEVESVEVETSMCNCSDDDERIEQMSHSELQTNSQEMDSTVKTTEANPHRMSPVQKMPTELELEEFFTAAEKDLQKRFAEKYNYDIVKDVPLEGRYEWVRLKP